MPAIELFERIARRTQQYTGIVSPGGRGGQLQIGLFGLGHGGCHVPSVQSRTPSIK